MRLSRAKRIVFSLVPLVALLALTEAVASYLAARALQSRQLELPTSAMGRFVPARADADTPAEHVVVCLGDSWTFGVGLAAEDAYPAQLEALLRGEHGLDVNVINLGEPGATPLHMARRLNQYLQAHGTDVVIALMGSNADFAESLAIAAGETSPLLRLRPLLHRLTSFKLLVQLVARGRVTSHDILSTDEFIDKPAPFAGQGSPPPPINTARQLDAARARQNVADNVARIDDLSAAVGAELALLTYALPSFAEERERGPLPAANEALREAARARGLPLLEMDGLYARHDQDGPQAILGVSLVSGNRDMHPSALGYGLYAEEIADWLAPRLD